MIPRSRPGAGTARPSCPCSYSIRPCRQRRVERRFADAGHDVHQPWRLPPRERRALDYPPPLDGVEPVNWLV
jgi:hypothetical protein